MANLGAAHKGYLYQDIATAYFLATALIDPVRSVSVDHKYHLADRFDDLCVFDEDGTRRRHQFKHTDTATPFAKKYLSSEIRDLRVDTLVRSWREDPTAVRAHEYRLCATWTVPTDPGDLQLLTPVDTPGSFGDYPTRRFRVAIERLWPVAQKPLWSCLRGIRRADLAAFARIFIIELECPPASSDLGHPGTLEQLVADVLGARVGFGQFPNEHRTPMGATEKLVITATRARIAGASGSAAQLTPIEIAGEVGLVTDYGRIAQHFPFLPARFVPAMDLRRGLLQRVDAGGITVLAGKPGSGKSWELTALARTLRRRGDVVASHYCYLEPGDPAVQRRITLNVFYGNLIAEILDALPKLRAKNIARYAAGPNELQALLSAAAELRPARRLIVIVDGLDHIARVLRDAPGVAPEDTAIAADVLALNLPPLVSVLVGSQPGDHIAALARAGQLLTVPEWGDAAVAGLLRRVPLGNLLQRRRLSQKGLVQFVGDLRNRAQGNALYCTYLCREVTQRLKDDTTSDPLTVLGQLPASAGMLSTYYEFLFASLDQGGAMVADAMGLVDFGVTPAELAEIFPAYQSGLPRILHNLAPILEETRGRGGLRIYHESFRRHILDKAQQRGDRLGPKLKDVIAWLEGRGFLEDSRAYRFLLPNLVRADCAAEAFARIDINFVAASFAAGHSATAIEANLALFANLAARALDFPKLIRAIELFRSLGACIDNLDDLFGYGSAYAAIFGAPRLAERLTFDGAATLHPLEGIKLCSLCDDAGVTPPWHAYLERTRQAEKLNENVRASSALFHGMVRTGGGSRLRPRLMKWLKNRTSPDRMYLQNVLRRWGEFAGAEDLPKLLREAKCTGEIAVTVELEYARATDDPSARVAAATRAGVATKNAAAAIEALRLGAPPKGLARFIRKLDEIDIGVGGRHSVQAEPLESWVSGVRVAAYLKSALLDAERIRIRGAGWYREWLAFVITLAEIERQASKDPDDAADDVMRALRHLARDVKPFTGDPRACDLYAARHCVAESIESALRLLRTPAQWQKALEHLKAISSGTTTSIDRSPGGPLTPSSLFELVAPFAKRPELRDLIRRSIEPLVEDQHGGHYFVQAASDEMAFASLLATIGDQAAAVTHWNDACLNLCAYGMRKDTTIYDILESVRALKRAGKTVVADRLARLLPLTYAVVLHTDGRETRHCIGEWFRQLAESDYIGAAWLLGRSITDDGGSYDYRLEEGLDYWVEHAGEFAPDWRRRLEMIVEGPITPESIRKRLARLEPLFVTDRAAAELELQLIAAAVHGDALRLPADGYAALRDFATTHGCELPAGVPDVSFPPREETQFNPEPDAQAPILNWEAPASPQTMVHRLRSAMDDRKITNAQLLEYCRPYFRQRSGSHPAELDEIILFMARLDRFGNRAKLLSDLGTDLEASGKNQLAARALTLAYTRYRGGGGWLTFGGEEHEDLLVRACRASREVALATLAQETVHRLNEATSLWGASRHLVGFFGRHDDAVMAVAMWDEACDVIAHRLPRHENERGPFLPFEPAAVPPWSLEVSGLFLILARLGHPEKKRKTVALGSAAWMLAHFGDRCATAFRAIFQSGPSFTHQLTLLQLLHQFETEPYALSQELAPELNQFVGSGRFGTELLALLLLRRAKVPVTAQILRMAPLIGAPVSKQKEEAILTLDIGERVEKLAELWPEIGGLVAGRFDSVYESSPAHKARCQDRHEAVYARGQKNFPRAPFTYWEKELFEDALHEVATGLEKYLWSKGEWDDDLPPRVLSLLVPSIRIPVANVLSRRVRPSWPLPEALATGTGDVVLVPDGEFAGWIRVAYSETHLDQGEHEYNDLKQRTTALAGVVLEKDIAMPKDGGLPLTYPHAAGWRRPFARTTPLADFHGPFASLDAVGGRFHYHEILGLSPMFLAGLGLSPRKDIGPLDLFDAEGKLAVAHRWWAVRPLGAHGFADENPRLNGTMLLMHPDLYAEIVKASELKAFEVRSVKIVSPVPRNED
jgi:hypothetical protein